MEGRISLATIGSVVDLLHGGNFAAANTALTKSLRGRIAGVAACSLAAPRTHTEAEVVT